MGTCGKWNAQSPCWNTSHLFVWHTNQTGSKMWNEKISKKHEKLATLRGHQPRSSLALREADALLGLPPGHGRVMKLTKPMYGLVDGPNLEDGWWNLCPTSPGRLPFPGVWPQDPTNPHDAPQLLAIFGLQVDDLLGCCMRRTPTPRSWWTPWGALSRPPWVAKWSRKDELTYCGAKIVRLGDQQQPCELCLVDCNGQALKQPRGFKFLSAWWLDQ